MEKIDTYFPESYEESRRTFRGHLDKIKQKWPQAELVTEQIGKEVDNTIDMIKSDANASNDKVLFFTTGEHGIEGYAGAAVTHMFVEEYLDRIDPRTTGICFVHALNPWGMKHFRRVTENNVDLNRHYVYDSVPEDVNKKFEKESDLFLPNGKIHDLEHEKKKLYAQLAKGLAKEGYSGIKEAKGMGQFQFHRGVYYGGKKEEEPAVFLKKVQHDLLSTYPRVIHMDWHTALGPTNELTMVISEQDSREQGDLEKAYNMKNIEKFAPTKVKGDSTYHFHKLKNEDYPDTYLFSALFEFGTFGTGKKAELREFMTIVLENHLYWEGAENPEDRKWIQDEFRAMFYPKEQEWLESVLQEAKGGIDSVLTREEIMK
ncbi:M14 family metallopeptidase [Alkalihalobacillus sp. CinArs1]|uniref:M14 family metallopeptidase n=1 Tax=Alkalihalobacillus sp. CinArs1 TaxID=2995314 RepID=UPI0022DE531D|nr:M14 family metallopeptidase [Alkalihalobacillus sp. CinArs1]